MTGDRQISVYSGQTLLGFVVERSDKSCIAKDASSRKLGRFPTIQQAVKAIGEVAQRGAEKGGRWVKWSFTPERSCHGLKI